MRKWKILNVTLLQSYNVTFGIMRAKEYIAQNADSIGHLAEVRSIGTTEIQKR